MKTILLTNDDGYLAEGIRSLRDRLSTNYDVYIVAPDRERSGISLSITINHPMRIKRVNDKEYVVDGTPTDCINIALQKIITQQPDFIISGMNHGENLCEDVFFSGTVAGAYIGSLYGVPSMAVSLIDANKDHRFDFAEGARITEVVLEKLLPLKNTNVVYNLNIPTPHNGKILATSLGCKRYKPSLVERVDPRGMSYYWMGTGNPSCDGEEGSDLWATSRGNISLSVLKYDLNDTEERKKLSEIVAL
ncbi:MAG TPA: 5'/3'-nucleotidase SurE [Candidatus Deferrimicrobium sp.]|nr:5'/3'-nucleotidase SurE [Candidatus Deferrimicrobium sp.]